MVESYIPEKGDIVWLDFTPQSGHEQKGRRPALVLSHRSYNQRIGLAIFCPITGKEKGYPFEVKLEGLKTCGCVLSDQVKSLDWIQRNIEFIERTSDEVIEDVLSKFLLLIQ